MAEISEIGFIQKINSIYPKIDTIVESGELFSDEVVETLNRLENKDLSFVISDLRKDTYLGNRKIDIDIALNKKGIEELTDYNEIMNIWTNVQTTVYYSSINAIFIDNVFKKILILDFSFENILKIILFFSVFTIFIYTGIYHFKLIETVKKIKYFLKYL